MPENQFDVGSVGPPSIRNEQGVFYSEAQAQAIFRQLASDTRNPFKARNDCDLRCELMLLDMINHLCVEPRCIQRALGTVEAPGRLNAPDRLRNRLKALRDKSGCPAIADYDLQTMLFDLDETIRNGWGFHKAAAIEIWDDAKSKPATLVLDPSIADHALRSEQWMAALGSPREAVFYHGRLGQKLDIDPELLTDMQMRRVRAHLAEAGIVPAAAPVGRSEVEVRVRQLSDEQKDALVESLFPKRTRRTRTEGGMSFGDDANPRYMVHDYRSNWGQTRKDITDLGQDERHNAETDIVRQLHNRVEQCERVEKALDTLEAECPLGDKQSIVERMEQRGVSSGKPDFH